MKGAASRPIVIFRADASEQIGGGHLMRCLCLADALARRGFRALFAAAAIPSALADRVLQSGHELRRIESEASSAGDAADWDLRPLGAEAQRRDAAQTLAAAASPDVQMVVLDHYRLDRAWLASLDRPAIRLVIDDLANRLFDCEILLDQTHGRRAAHYDALVPEGCRLLTGAQFALLRPEFARLRAAALARRTAAAPARRLLISMGTTDVGGITGRVLAEVLAADVDCTTDVVLSPASPSLAQVRALAEGCGKVELHTDFPELAPMMVEADLAIGAAGATSWERCCLGLPCLTLALAANQRFLGEQLAEAGAVRLALGEPGAEFRAMLADLVADAEARKRMSDAAAAVTDGLGTERVCDQIVQSLEETRR